MTSTFPDDLQITCSSCRQSRHIALWLVLPPKKIRPYPIIVIKHLLIQIIHHFQAGPPQRRLILPSVSTFTKPFPTLNLRRGPLILRKPQTNAINTVSLIRRSWILFPLEHMPQMPSTIRADNLRPRHAKRFIRMPSHRPRNGIKIRWPPTPGLELVRGFV